MACAGTRAWGASLEEHEESMVKLKRAVIPIEALRPGTQRKKLT